MFDAIKNAIPPSCTGYKIPQIENMGATLDQFDTVDFSDNDLRKLDGFPYLPRLKCLLLNNNRIVYVYGRLVGGCYYVIKFPNRSFSR